MADNVNSQVGDSHSVEDHFEHPTPFTYVKVAIALVVITAIEVGVFYLEWLGKGIIPVLAILSGMKFALVIMFYMLYCIFVCGTPFDAYSGPISSRTNSYGSSPRCFAAAQARAV